MRIGKRRIGTYLFCVICLLLTVWTAEDCHAQKRRKNKDSGKNEKVSVQDVRSSLQKNPGDPELNADRDNNMLPFFVEEGDTIYYDTITASKVYSRIPKQKGREWREYYKLVHNFSKSYPYALVAKKLAIEADSTIAADKLKGIKREKYINQMQQEIFDVFEGAMRKLTVSQGMLIMKLIDREVGKSSYAIIKDYKSGVAAGFWQGIAKFFGTDMKKHYDPEGEDKAVEELVQIWKAGDFNALYWSLFWQDPPELNIPERFL